MKSKTKTPPEERWLHAVPNPEPGLRPTRRAKRLSAALGMSAALIAGTQLGSSSDNAEKHLDDKIAVMTKFEQRTANDGQGLTNIIEEAIVQHAIEEGEPIPQLDGRTLELAAHAIRNTIRRDAEEQPDRVDIMSNYPENETLPELDKGEKIYVPVEYRPINE